MHRTFKWWQVSSRACTTLSLLAAAGCATQRLPDVGAVVVAPQVKLPPVPALAQQTEPKPPGYFSRTLADFLNGS